MANWLKRVQKVSESRPLFLIVAMWLLTLCIVSQDIIEIGNHQKERHFHIISFLFSFLFHSWAAYYHRLESWAWKRNENPGPKTSPHWRWCLSICPDMQLSDHHSCSFLLQSAFKIPASEFQWWHCCCKTLQWWWLWGSLQYSTPYIIAEGGLLCNGLITNSPIASLTSLNSRLPLRRASGFLSFSLITIRGAKKKKLFLAPLAVLL